jgi:hypothetical protein
MGSIILKKDILIIGLLINLLFMIGYFLLNRDEILVILAISSSLIVTFLTNNLNFNENVNYILDYLITLMLVKNIIYFISGKIKFRKIYIFFIVFLVFSVVSAIYNKINIMIFMKALYSDYIRYGILMLSIINFNLSDNVVKKYIKFLWMFLLIQVPIVIFQDLYGRTHWYPKLPGDIRQDYISGLIGGRGTAELGAIICMALGCIFVLYQNKKISLKYFIIHVILLIYILIIAEIKFAFILLIMVFIIISIVKPKLRNFVIILFSTVMILVGINILQKVYPDFAGFFQKNNITVYLESNYGGSNLSRLTAFNTANKEISKTSENKLIGFGAGTGTIKETNSKDFNEFQKYNIYDFKMFTCSQYLAENGWIGFLCIYGIFLYEIFISYSLMKKEKNQFEIILGTCGIYLGSIIIMITVYSLSMTKINFAVIAWSVIGLICRYYYKTSDC